ncbi:MAG TPA: hypothetical protein VN239_06605 [Nitrososphaera sp.]|jgi:hypothetical protein|nr:hypothetical protein [Nitrososphaera sp.]
MSEEDNNNSFDDDFDEEFDEEEGDEFGDEEEGAKMYLTLRTPQT